MRLRSEATEEERREAIEEYNRSMRSLPRAAEEKSPEGFKGYGESIEETVKALSPVLGIAKNDLRTALRTALRHVAHKATMEDRYDVVQLLAVKLLEMRPPSGRYATVACRNTVRHWNARFIIRQHYSLDYDDTKDTPDETYRDVLLGIVEFEADTVARMDAQHDGRKLWRSLPATMKQIVVKRMRGARLSGAEKVMLHRYRKSMIGVFEAPIAV